MLQHFMKTFKHFLTLQHTTTEAMRRMIQDVQFHSAFAPVHVEKRSIRDDFVILSQSPYDQLQGHCKAISKAFLSCLLSLAWSSWSSCASRASPVLVHHGACSALGSLS